MIDPPRCAFGDECPQKRLVERKVVETLDKYRKETVETYDLCDGTLLKTTTVIEGDFLNGRPWDNGFSTEKMRTEGKSPRCSIHMVTPCHSCCRSSDSSPSSVESDIVQPTLPKSILRPPSVLKEPREEPLLQEALTLSKELERLELAPNAKPPHFPTCLYWPPRPASKTSHVSEDTVYDTSPFDQKDRLPEPPIPFLRRTTPTLVDERSILKNPEKRLPRQPSRASSRLEERSVDFREITDTRVESRQSAWNSYREPEQETRILQGSTPPLENIVPRDSPRIFVPIRTENILNYPLDPPPFPRPTERPTLRSSSRFEENCYYLLESSSQRRREESPQPRGDIPRGTSYMIPVRRREYVGIPYEERTTSRIQEELITKETFERTTTSRKMYPNTLV